MAIQIFGDLEVSLNGITVKKFLKALEQQSTLHWKRNREAESRIDISPHPMYCFLYSSDDKDAPLKEAHLWLLHKGDRIRVVNILSTQDTDISPKEYNALLTKFGIECMEPAAKSLNLALTPIKTEADLTDFVSAETANLLNRYAVLANKSTGNSHPYDRARWFEFLFSYHRHREELPPDFLCDWLHKQGWSMEEAKSLTEQFRQESELLREYDLSA